MCDKEVLLKLRKVWHSLPTLQRAEGIFFSFEGMHGVCSVHKGFYQLVLCVHLCVCVSKLIYLPKISSIMILWNMQNVQLAMRRFQHFTQW